MEVAGHLDILDAPTTSRPVCGKPLSQAPRWVCISSFQAQPGGVASGKRAFLYRAWKTRVPKPGAQRRAISRYRRGLTCELDGAASGQPATHSSAYLKQLGMLFQTQRGGWLAPSSGVGLGMASGVSQGRVVISMSPGWREGPSTRWPCRAQLFLPAAAQHLAPHRQCAAESAGQSGVQRTSVWDAEERRQVFTEPSVCWHRCWTSGVRMRGEVAP